MYLCVCIYAYEDVNVKCMHYMYVFINLENCYNSQIRDYMLC
jgi:hypothetical protein